MGKPPTREIAGLVWTYDGAVWCSGDHLIIRYEDDKGIVDYLATGPDDMFTRLADACEAEVRWAAEQEAEEATGLVWTYDAERMGWSTPCGLLVRKFHDGYIGAGTGLKSATVFPTLTAACEAEVAHREATRASPTLTPGELEQMLGDPTPALPDPTAEREAQRRDTRAHYRNLAGWAVAALVLVALCSGVLSCRQPSDSNKSPNPAPGGDTSGVENER